MTRRETWLKWNVDSGARSIKHDSYRNIYISAKQSPKYSIISENNSDNQILEVKEVFCETYRYVLVNITKRSNVRIYEAMIKRKIPKLPR